MIAMRAAVLIGLTVAGAASAQIVPLGAPVIPQPKATAAPPPPQNQTGQLRPTRPLGSNYSPYGLQPQGRVTAIAPSAAPAQPTVNSGVVADPTLPDEESKKPSKPASMQQSDMQKLAPKGAERTELPKADAAAPGADAPPQR